jgi:hypothetical protein
MDSARIRIVRKQNAPKTYPCPHCCTPGRRKDTHTRQIRDIAYGEIVFIELAEYSADPDLAWALAMLSPEKFDKMMAFLHSPKSQQVRTNNHVERTNRSLRYLEKVRYKWRRRRTIVRFIVLALDRWRRQRGAKKVNSITTDQPQGQSSATQAT